MEKQVPLEQCLIEFLYNLGSLEELNVCSIDELFELYRDRKCSNLDNVGGLQEC